MGKVDWDLERIAILSALLFVLALLIFELLNKVGILPFYYFSSNTCCIMPTGGVAMILFTYTIKKYGVKASDQKTQERLERSFKFSILFLGAELVIGGVTTVLELFLFGIFLFGGPDLLLFSLVGMVLVLVGGLIASGLVLYYGWKYVYKGPSKPEEHHIFPPSRDPHAVNDTIFSENAGDPITGTWYCRGKALVVFHHDGTFDMADASRKGQADAYIGGTFTRDHTSYFLHPVLVGRSQEEATKIPFTASSSSSRQLILQGSRLYDVYDISMEFFRYDEDTA